MDLGLKGQVVAITGAASGIGRACAELFAGEGADLALVDLDEEGLRAVADELLGCPVTVRTFGADIADPAGARAAIDGAHNSFGKLDALINCAGIYRETPVPDLPLEQWNLVQAVNMGGTFLCCQAALKHMKKQRRGCIVNIASLAGQVGGIVAGADYAVSKAGVICLTKSLAKQCGPFGIRVNTISPGPLESPMTAEWPPGRKEDFAAQNPLGRIGTPEDVAKVALFLCSDLAGYVNGARVDVNGGLLTD